MTIFVVDPNNPLPSDPTISNFDPTKDFIQLPNPSADEVLTYFSYTDHYTLETVGSDTHILTTEGDLIAVIEGVTELKPFTGFTPNSSIYLVSLENEFFSTYIEPSFFEPWYLEQDVSDYGNSVQEAIDAGIVDSAYEHYLKIGQFEGREDAVFFGTEGNDILYGTGAEPVLIGVPITEAVYARDNVPVTTGEGELDTLVGSPGGDTFVLGNGTTINDAPQSYYVGGGEGDYALIKGLSGNSVTFTSLGGFDDATIDRLFLGGRHYDYLYEKVGEDLRVLTRNGDLVAIIEDAPVMETPFSIPGANYLYGIDNVKTFDALWGASSGFYDPFYFAENPGVEAAIERGEYASAIDHYFQVGQFQANSEVIFHDPNNEGFVVGYGPSDLLSGVPLTFVDGEQEGYRTATTGVGEQDFYLGGVGVTTYFIGNDNILDPGTEPEVWYVGQGDEDYVIIQNFDPYKDFIFGAGEFADYTFETVDSTQDVFGRIVPIKNLEISYQGDLVTVLWDVASSLTVPELQLIEFPLGDERPNGLALVAPQNQFLPPPSGSEFFNESIYLAVYPEVAEQIAAGQYSSALAHYTSFGQFNGFEGFFTGTNGSDAVRGFGEDKDLYGVEIEASRDGDIITLTPNSLGVDEIDVLLGDEGEDGFYLGVPVSINEITGETTTQALYIGEGTLDYGLIRNFSDDDSIYLAGDPTDYIYKSEGGDFRIFSATGDLIGVVQNIPELQVSSYTEGSEGFTLGITEAGFDDEGWLSLFPEVAEQIDQGFFESALDQYINVGQYQEGGWVFEGTTGNDTLISWTQNAEVRLTGVTLEAGFEPSGFEDGQFFFGVNPTSFGVGEIDIFVHSTDTGTITESLLGWFRHADGSIQRFYVGQGDQDYALVKNFDKNDLDELFFGGAPEEYTYEDVGENLHVSYQGDLVTIVEGVQFNELELASEGEGSGAFVLIGIPDGNPSNEPPGAEFFNEAIYLSQTPNAREAVEAGEYETGLDYYIAVGQFRLDEEGIFHGTDGNDTINGFGLRTDLYGVELDVEGQFVENPNSPFGISGSVTYIPQSLGVGEIDVLVGSDDSIDEYFFGSELTIDVDTFTGTSTPLYVGQGDADYAIAQNFDVTDPDEIVILAGAPKDYFYRSESDGFQVYTKEGDLVGIVEDVPQLRIASEFSPFFDAFDLFNLTGVQTGTAGFDEDIYLLSTPAAAEAVAQGLYSSGLEYYIEVGQYSVNEEGEPGEGFFTGTDGNDYIIGFGASAGLSGVGIKARTDINPFAYEFESLGTGEVDVLIGGEGENGFLLGTITNPANPKSRKFYVGNGDEDYALIQNFDTAEDSIILAGKPKQYTFTPVEGNLEISTRRGDLVGIVEGVTDLGVTGVFREFGIFIVGADSTV